MNTKVIHFNDALPIATQAIHDAGVDAGALIVRDLYGRIRVAFDGVPDPHHDVLPAALAALGAFGVSQDHVLLYRADFFDPDGVLNDPGILNVQVPGYDFPFRLLDRRDRRSRLVDAS